MRLSANNYQLSIVNAMNVELLNYWIVSKYLNNEIIPNNELK